MGAEFRWRRSLATRLTIGFVLTALATVVLVSVLLVGLLRLTSAAAALADLRRQANVIAREPRILEREPKPVIRVLVRSLGLSDAALYRVAPDRTLVRVAGSELVPVAELDVEALAEGEIVEGTLGGRPEVVFVARPLGGRATRVIVLSRRAGLVPGLPGDIAGRLVIAALGAIAFAAVFAFWLARRISRPMKDLAAAAAQIARGNFESRVAVSSSHEVGVVAQSFNTMAADLAAADERQREFFLEISHELRTPLTAIQGYAEAIEDGTVSGAKQIQAAEVIVRESRRVARLVSDLLDLAKLDAHRFQVSLDEVEIENALTAVKQAFAPKANEAGIEIRIGSSAGAVLADYDRLIQVLSNLVENALRYTPAKKQITLESAEAGGWAEIRVVDGGIGLEEEDLGRAFERQYLWKKYRGLRDVGTGLGLAISRELVQAMGGSVQAKNAAEGGAEFAIRLPINPPPAQ